MRQGPPETIVEVVGERAARDPDRIAFTFEGDPVSYGDLWAAAGRVAGCLQGLGVAPGDRVVMALPNGPAFFAALFGSHRAGATAVPVFPSLGPETLVARADAASARIVVVPGSFDRAERLAAAAAGRGVTVVHPDHWEEAPPGADTVVRPDEVAVIQHTSGSTGEPRRVLISHRNLQVNVGQLIAGMRITPEDRFVSWLPAYHDMGLVLMSLVPFTLGAELHVLETRLSDVTGWLQTMHDTRATVTAAPDFAYRLCLRNVDDPGRFDLTALRMALNAAEPVRAETMAAFEEAFGLRGAMTAGYGLAEATVGVATWPPGTRPPADERGYVCVGPPFPGVKLRIDRDGHPAAAGETGEILVSSTANALGYDGDPEETAAVFGEDGYIRTGDLGYLDGGGNLTIVGRKKEVIILAGRTLAPHEIARIADRRPEMRLAAAVGIDRGGVEGEQVHVVAEVRHPDAGREAWAALASEITRDVRDALGFRPGRVHLLRPGSIPLTGNGKVRYLEIRERVLAGTLEGVLYPDW